MKTSPYSTIKKLGNQTKRKFTLVYLVKNEETNEICVLKKITKTEKTRTTQQLLEQEAKFTFDHPSLPQVIGKFESEDELEILFRFKKGEQLDLYWEKLNRNERIPFIQKWMEKMCIILEFLKQQSIVHCDLKPSNILIEKKTSDFEIHLIDFGLAIRQSDLNNRKLVFPLGYAAPELILNQLDLADWRTDQFSMGICIWRLFTGKLPHTHPNPAVMTNLQLNLPTPSHTSIPAEIFCKIEKMTAKKGFNLPPNQLSTHEVRSILLQGKELRFNEPSELNLEIKPKKYAFIKHLIQIFSKS